MVLALLTGSLIGCIEVNTQPRANQGFASSKDFKVAILLPDVINDGTFSQAGYEGLKRIERELNAEVAYSEKIDLKTPKEIENLYFKYAQEGFNLIIGHGSQHLTLPAAKIVAKEFPRSKFIMTVGDNSGNNQNLGVLSFRSEELGYLAGVVAGLKTKTKKISVIGGIPYDYITKTLIAFEKGAESIKPDINITIEWVGNWVDSEKAKALAKKQIQSGVDIIVIWSEPAGIPLYEMAKDAGIFVIGWTKDQYERAPGHVITSAIIKYPELLLYGANLVQEGRWEGKKYTLGIREGVLELADFRGSLTPSEVEIVNQVKFDILTRKIDFYPASF